MSLRLLLTLSGGLETLVGVLTLISPATDRCLTGGPVDASTIVLARLFGAGVFALGLACLKARDDVRSPAGLAVSIGITRTTCWPPWFYSGLRQGRVSAACCCGERGSAMLRSVPCLCQQL